MEQVVDTRPWQRPSNLCIRGHILDGVRKGAVRGRFCKTCKKAAALARPRNHSPDPSRMKVCCYCKRNLPREQFTKNCLVLDGLSRYCRKCSREQCKKKSGSGRSTPEKNRARSQARYAVKTGRLIKPNKCESCQREFPKERLQGHHEDYGKPLEVRWLCQICHTDAHLAVPII